MVDQELDLHSVAPILSVHYMHVVIQEFMGTVLVTPNIQQSHALPYISILPFRSLPTAVVPEKDEDRQFDTTFYTRDTVWNQAPVEIWKVRTNAYILLVCIHVCAMPTYYADGPRPAWNTRDRLRNPSFAGRFPWK